MHFLQKEEILFFSQGKILLILNMRSKFSCEKSHRTHRYPLEKVPITTKGMH